MKLCIINGSPRGKKSNSQLLMEKFIGGFSAVDSEYPPDTFYLKTEKDHQKIIQALEEADLAILVFPLYTDIMPGIVKHFIESFDPANFYNKKLKLGFIVHSGFPEAFHSSFLKRYLEKWSSRLGIQCLGVAIKGGTEGVRIQPRWMTRYTDLYYELGQHLALEEEFNSEVVAKLGNPKHLRGGRLLFYRLLRATGLSNFYWNSQLKQNNVYKNRFAQPYLKQ